MELVFFIVILLFTVGVSCELVCDLVGDLLFVVLFDLFCFTDLFDIAFCFADDCRSLDCLLLVGVNLFTCLHGLFVSFGFFIDWLLWFV